MAPDVDLTTVPLIPVSPLSQEDDPNRPETEEDGLRAGALRREMYRRKMVPRESTEQPDLTQDS